MIGPATPIWPPRPPARRPFEPLRTATSRSRDPEKDRQTPFARRNAGTLQGLENSWVKIRKMGTRNRTSLACLAAIIVVIQLLAIAVVVVRRENSPVRTARSATATASHSPIEGDPNTPKTPKLPAPEGRREVDDGVIDAARQFAVQF